MLGYIINERYQLQTTLGEGGFGVVYRAVDLHLKRDVAIKVLNLNAQKDPQQAERFMSEARITSKLAHPYLLTLYDSGQITQLDIPNEHVLVGQLFIVSELLKGASLELILEHKALSLPQMMKVLTQVSEALSVAHEANVIHRDIKPPNLFVHRAQLREQMKLLDFGIAKVADEQSHTLTGQLFGTPYYMSPEQIYGQKDLTLATDIYSLGVLTFHCLAGRVPFEGDSQYMIFHKHINEPVPPLSRHFPELMEPALQGLIERMMAKRPSERFQSASEVLVALDELRARFPSWFIEPTPLLEGVTVGRVDTAQKHVSELPTDPYQALPLAPYDSPQADTDSSAEAVGRALSLSEEVLRSTSDERDVIPTFELSDEESLDELLEDDPTGEEALNQGDIDHLALPTSQLTLDELEERMLGPTSAYIAIKPEGDEEPFDDLNELTTDPVKKRSSLSSPPPMPAVSPFSSPQAAPPSPPPPPLAAHPVPLAPPVLRPSRSLSPREELVPPVLYTDERLEEVTEVHFKPEQLTSKDTQQIELSELMKHNQEPQGAEHTKRRDHLSLMLITLSAIIIALVALWPNQPTSSETEPVSKSAPLEAPQAQPKAPTSPQEPPSTELAPPLNIPLPQGLDTPSDPDINLQDDELEASAQRAPTAQKKKRLKPQPRPKARTSTSKARLSKKRRQTRASSQKKPLIKTAKRAPKAPQAQPSEVSPQPVEPPKLTKITLSINNRTYDIDEAIPTIVRLFDQKGEPFKAAFHYRWDNKKGVTKTSAVGAHLQIKEVGKWYVKACVEDLCSSARQVVTTSVFQ